MDKLLKILEDDATLTPAQPPKFMFDCTIIIYQG